LNEVQQRQLMVRLAGALDPGRKKKGGKAAPQEHVEMWMAAANLERLPVRDKTKWGKILLNELPSYKSKTQFWWALGRIGCREPLYGPVDRVVPADEAARWIETLLARPWPNPQAAGSALARMARLTGDRKRDVEERVRRSLVDRLKQAAVSETHVRLLEDVVPVGEEEETVQFGESLPPGLILHDR